MASSSLVSIGTVEAAIIYESLPTTNSTNISKHGSRGPVLADDFTSPISGLVTQVEWWGSIGLSGGTDQWELTFHSDSGGTPSTAYPSGVLSQHILNAAGTDADGDGIYHFSSLWALKTCS